MENKTEKKSSNLYSNKTLNLTISLDAIAKIKAKRLAKKRSAKEEAEKVESLAEKRKNRERSDADVEHKAWVVREAKKRWRVEKPLSQMNGTTDMSCGLKLLEEVYDAKSHRLRIIPREKLAVPLAGSCSSEADSCSGTLSGEEAVKLAPHSAKDEKKPAKKPAHKAAGQKAPRKKHRKRQSRARGSKAGTPMAPAPKQPSKLVEVPIVPPHLETLPKYSRYTQEKFLMPVAIQGKKELGINTLGSNLAKLRSCPMENLRGLLRQPIIVVPQAVTSLITLHNAKEMLQHMHFVQVDMQRPLGTLRPEEVVIERDFPNGKAKEYRIIDNVSKLCTDEWERVIAVFALGPHWQFKGWPWNGDPAVIFHKVCAFHLYYKDVGVHKDLLNMEMHPLEISKNEPHTHSGILKDFWGTLDKYVLTQSQFSFLVKEGAYFPTHTL